MTNETNAMPDVIHAYTIQSKYIINGGIALIHGIWSNFNGNATVEYIRGDLTLAPRNEDKALEAFSRVAESSMGEHDSAKEFDADCSFVRSALQQQDDSDLVKALEKVRDRFFPADQHENDRDLLWDEVNEAIAAHKANK